MGLRGGSLGGEGVEGVVAEGATSGGSQPGLVTRGRIRGRPKQDSDASGDYV